MFPSVNAEVARWLADDFISPEKIKSISLSQKGRSDTAWKLTRDTEEAEFKLEGAAGAEVLDTAVTSPLKSLFSYARFDDVVPADKVAEKADPAGKRSAVIETVEGFKYTLEIIPVKGAEDKFLLTVAVAAELPKERKKEEGEKPEDAKTKDTAFTDRLKALTEKLQKEQKLAGRTFEIGKSTVEPLLKERDQLITKATPPPADGCEQRFRPATPRRHRRHFARTATTARQTATTPPIEAVTPPIAVPSADEEEEEEE